MREQIDTIPLNDAFLSGDECPFCYLERMIEQRAIRYVLGPGASYMEPDVRAATDAEGFCVHHYKKLYDFGNALGNALMMQTRYAGMLKQLDQARSDFEMPQKRPLFGSKRQTAEPENALLQWARAQNGSCYICRKISDNMQRYYSTFFAMIKDQEFRTRVENCKGFCVRHFAQFLESAQSNLPNNQREWFYTTAADLMQANLERVKGDIDHFVGMFDYRNAGRDWKNSRDAVSRGMQKLQGQYPADPPYKLEK